MNLKKCPLFLVVSFVMLLLQPPMSKAQQNDTKPLHFDMQSQAADRTYAHLPITYKVDIMEQDQYLIQVYWSKNCLVKQIVTLTAFSKTQVNQLTELLIQKLKADLPLDITNEEINHIQSTSKN
jgi:hypothetical protein